MMPSFRTLSLECAIHWARLQFQSTCYSCRLRQNSMRTENRAIPCRDCCPIQVTLHPRAPRIAPRGNPRAAYMYLLRMGELGRFRDATLVRIRQPDHTGGAVLPVADEKRRDLKLWSEFCRLAFPSRVRDACGLLGSSEYTPRAGVSGGVRQLQ